MFFILRAWCSIHNNVELMRNADAILFLAFF
jgi:hypothetical protein